MAKLIKSAFIVLTVAIIAGGATYSFFGDEEKSTGNTFSAGKIDLKVDSEAHYNGLVCTNGTWQLPGVCEPTGSNLIQNGGFENPEVTNGAQWDVFADGASGLDWDVQWVSPSGKPAVANIELHEGVLGAAEEGDQYAELDTDWGGPSDTVQTGEPASVRIKQNIPTTSGNKYRLTFQFSPRPNTPSTDNQLEVKADGALLDTVSGAGGGSISWSLHSYEFIAIGSSTEISFADLGTENSLGTFLDDVDVHELDCPATESGGLIGTPCYGTWSLTDLGAHKFFNFLDIKPGDFGEDTVSLHVYDNDAWGRLVIGGVTDTDNTCVEPELNPVDTDCPDTSSTGGDGELRENLEFSVWLDEGQTAGFQGKGTDPGEGDNIQNFNEPTLVTPGPIDLGGETHNIWQGIAAAYAAHGCTDPTGHTNYGLCNGLSQDGHMVASTTYYFGIGWNLPDSVGNEAQTDIFTADMTFEVEQYRNNPSPF